MIREFRHRDMDQVLTIWLEASIQAHHFIPREYWESKVTDMRELYLPNSDTYLYEDNGEVKGFIALYENTVAALFVLPGSQNQGIGGKLIQKAKDLCPSLRLTVYKENANGLRFYEKCGFRVVQEQADEHTGHPELVMLFP